MPSFLPNMFRNFKKMSPKAPTEQDQVQPLDFIFSCSVCGDTLSEVYKGHNRTVQGLTDGINPQDRLVSRLFVGSCSHVICIKHIEGGNGPAFHAAGTNPQVTCPLCAEIGQGEPKELYSIRGFGPGELDPVIPPLWYTTPPKAINGSDLESGALRFQYLALVRYGKHAVVARKHLEQDYSRVQTEMNKELQDMRDRAAADQSKIASLEQELQRLRPLNSLANEFSNFKAQKPTILFYLGLLPRLIDEYKQMQQRLANLGFAMHFDPIPNSPAPFPLDTHGNLIDIPEGQCSTSRKYEENRSVSYKKTYEGGFQTSSSPQTKRPNKRLRVESPNADIDIHAPHSGRNMMPPPSKPVSRMRSMRRLIPNSIRKKFSTSRESSTATGTDLPNTDVQMYGHGYWEENDPHTETNSRSGFLPDAQSSRTEAGDCYMSGALPPAPKLADTVSDSQFGMQLNKRESEFSFRSKSPVKMDNLSSGALPTESSYLHLLDSLSDDNGLDFGIQDPRRRASHQGSQVPQHSQAEAEYSPQHGASVNPVTPAPASFQRPADETEKFVSPFFGSSQQRQPQFISPIGITERHRSMNHSASYRSQARAPEWDEAPSLNGLSFFDLPMNGMHRPINRTSYSRQAPSYSQPARNFQPGGYSSQSGVTRLSSAIPSNRSNRERTQWVNLDRVGVRSSNNSRSYLSTNTFTPPTNRFSSAGRRSVRR